MSVKGVVKHITNSLFRREFPMRPAGEAAPDFEAADHTGRRFKLSDYRGKHVVLWFFPKADTPG